MIELIVEEVVKKGYIMNIFFVYYMVMVKRVFFDIGIFEDKICFR